MKSPTTPPALTAQQAAAMRRKAENHLRQQQSSAVHPALTDDPLRLVHELQVHQIELEMQNAELQEAQERSQRLLEQYTDLYDFAPIGYFTLDDQGRIQAVNLTGASLLGAERSGLIKQPLARSLSRDSHADFHDFLHHLFAGSGQQACEVVVIKNDHSTFWASLHGTLPDAAAKAETSCRVVLSDLTTLKQTEAAQHRLEALAAAILTLEQEIVQRKESEGSLKKTRRQQSRLLAQSQQMQEQLRQLSHQMMAAQDDAHRQISKDLYAVINQALAGMSIRLEAMHLEAERGSTVSESAITTIKQSVDESIDLVAAFSDKFHPTVLDDLGLVPALRSFVQSFSRTQQLDISFATFAGVEKLNREKKTSLFHLVQEALSLLTRDHGVTHIAITITHKNHGAQLQLGSNTRTRDTASKTEKIKMLGMQERLEMVGGGFAVESSNAVGTTITAWVPFGKATGPVADNAPDDKDR